MKLLMHNLLRCHVKGVQNGFPLKIEATQVEVSTGNRALLLSSPLHVSQILTILLTPGRDSAQEVEADMDIDFLRRMMQRLDWVALAQGAKDIGFAELPETATEDMLSDDGFARFVLAPHSDSLRTSHAPLCIPNLCALCGWPLYFEFNTTACTVSRAYLVHTRETGATDDPLLCTTPVIPTVPPIATHLQEVPSRPLGVACC